ncbi:hypothetical protein [Acinetobacter rudis]|uniref:Lipoprotein n=1 Tax=Acinetobacter rudis TaxID=632955 RepID=A0AAW8JAU3_9GAMM|nr:hypothetical protein [Acinetobacter rudis]MDQ8936703.1 hypothetical protein [Acinetobacter rudis]MDQ8954066.1 hypothetical protein [Acinetobacter rudis]MDQ9018924.1 hypothetical protein [Acinetobacter rudis]
MRYALKKWMQLLLLLPLFSVLMACNDSDSESSTSNEQEASKPAVIRCAP